MIYCDKFGTDSLRLYLTGSPAAHAEPCQLNIENIKFISSKYLQLYNSFKFLMENLIKYEKFVNEFNYDAYKGSNNIMDIWILSLLGSVLYNINSYMKIIHYLR